MERVATHDVATERDVDLVRNRRNHHPDTSLAVEDLCLDDGAGIIDGRPDRGEESGDDRSDLALGLGIHRRGGFIEDQDAGIEGQGPGEGDELLLADREQIAALTDLLIVALLIASID